MVCMFCLRMNQISFVIAVLTFLSHRLSSDFTGLGGTVNAVIPPGVSIPIAMFAISTTIGNLLYRLLIRHKILGLIWDLVLSVKCSKVYRGNAGHSNLFYNWSSRSRQ